MTMYAVVNIDQLKRDIEAATSIEELKALDDKVEAIRRLYQKQNVSLDLQNQATEAHLRIVRAMGQMLDKNIPHDGGRPAEKLYYHGTVSPRLDDLGIDRHDSSRWQMIGKLPEETFEQHIAETKDNHKELTTSAVVQLAKKRDLEAMKAAIEAQAQAAPTKPLITLASWDIWLPQQSMCDLLLTDPPYSTDIADIDSFAQSWLPIALNKVKDSGRAYVCIGAYPQELRAYLNVPVPSHLRLLNVLVWVYRDTMGPQPTHTYKQNWQAVLYFVGLNAPRLDCPLMLEQFSVQEISAHAGHLGGNYHAWQKPDELAERFIRHSTKPGERVIDCYAGTGTFLLAAHRLGREAFGCDCSEEMLRIAEQRGCQIE